VPAYDRSSCWCATVVNGRIAYLLNRQLHGAQRIRGRVLLPILRAGCLAMPPTSAMNFMPFAVRTTSTIYRNMREVEITASYQYGAHAISYVIPEVVV
jgi:hypothetical protein